MSTTKSLETCIKQLRRGDHMPVLHLVGGTNDEDDDELFRIDESLMTDLIEAIQLNQTPTRIDIISFSIDVYAMLVLSDALACSRITEIYVRNVDLSCALSDFAHALRNNEIIKSFSFEGCDCQDEDLIDLADALAVNRSVTSFRMRDNEIGDEGMTALANTLKTNHTITSLDLGNNNIGDEGMIAFAKVLHLNTSVSSIELEYPVLSPESIQALAEALQVNSTITSISIVCDRMHDVSPILDALAFNQSVQHLYLSKIISDEEMNSLCRSLRVNTSITSIDLEAMSDFAMGRLVSVLEMNTTVVDVRGNYEMISSYTMMRLAQMIQVNTSIMSFRFIWTSTRMNPYSNTHELDKPIEPLQLAVHHHLNMANASIYDSLRSVHLKRRWDWLPRTCFE